MRSTLDAIVGSLRTQLHTHRNELVLLGDPIDDTETVLRITSQLPPNLRVGSILGVGLERMRIVNINPGPRLVTVVRGWNSHFPVTAHDAGDDVWVNSRFDAPSIAEAVYEEIQSWDADLFRVDDLIVNAPDDSLVPLPVGYEDTLGVVSVRRSTSAVGAARTQWPEIPFRVVWGRALPDSTGSGLHIRLLEPHHHGGELHVVIGRPFSLTAWQADTDLVSQVGLRSSMLDCVKMGALWRLVSTSEIGRSSRNAQGESRVAEEVPAGAAGQEALRLYSLYIRRLNTEVMRFRGQFPLRRS